MTSPQEGVNKRIEIFESDVKRLFPGTDGTIPGTKWRYWWTMSSRELVFYAGDSCYIVWRDNELFSGHQAGRDFLSYMAASQQQPATKPIPPPYTGPVVEVIARFPAVGTRRPVEHGSAITYHWEANNTRLCFNVPGATMRWCVYEVDTGREAWGAGVGFQEARDLFRRAMADHLAHGAGLIITPHRGNVTSPQPLTEQEREMLMAAMYGQSLPPQTSARPPRRCTCGGASVGGGHSSWCDV